MDDVVAQQITQGLRRVMIALDSIYIYICWKLKSRSRPFARSDISD